MLKDKRWYVLGTQILYAMRFHEYMQEKQDCW